MPQHLGGAFRKDVIHILRLDSFVDGVAGKRLTYKRLTQ